MWMAVGFVVLAVAGVSFYGGTKYASANRSSVRGTGQFTQVQFGGGNRGGFGGGGANGGFANGQILSKDANSITLSLRGGGSKIVLLSQSTSIMKSTEGTIDDLAVGKDVTVTGTANSDGSITAQSVALRPPMMATSTGARQN
jgi:hypothetical protein